MPSLSSLRLALPFALMLAASGQARAVGFDCITDNAAGDCAIGEAQLSVTFSSPAANQVRFDLTNVGGAAAVIAGVYVDDSSLLGSLASIVNGSGTSFVAGGEPPVLPGANDASPAFVVDFRASATAPPPTNGVGPGETLGLLFDLAGGVTVAEAQSAFANGSLRVGVHVIAFTSGGSESFVNRPVPEPSVALLTAAGLAALAATRRRSVSAS